MAVDIDAFVRNEERQDEIPPNPGLTPVYFGRHEYDGSLLKDLPEDYVAWCIHPSCLIDTEFRDWLTLLEYKPFFELHNAYDDWRITYDGYDPARVALWFGRHEGAPFSVIYENKWSLWWHRHESMKGKKWYHRLKELTEQCQAIDARNAQFRMTHSTAEVATAMARIHAAAA